MRKRMAAFDFIRAVSTIGIVFNHFAIDSKSRLSSFLDTFPNQQGSVGYSFVTVFFILSGALLYLHYSETLLLKKYYCKRWLSIFPKFYTAYTVVFLIRLSWNHNYLNGRSIWTVFWTLIGYDGYVGKCFPTFYILGEWFLGAIITLYILFPILVALFHKNEPAFIMTVGFLYFVFLDYSMFGQNPFRNVFSCILSFVIGFTVVKHKLYINKGLVLYSFFSIVALCFFPVKMSLSLRSHLVGVSLFFVLYYIGDLLSVKGFFFPIINKISRVSYEIFLIHHVTERYILKCFNSTSTLGAFIEMLVSSLIIYYIAVVFSFVFKYISEWKTICRRQ